MVKFFSKEIPKFCYLDKKDAGSLEEVPLPGPEWSWNNSSWEIQENEKTGKNGWEYAKSFNSSNFSRKNNMTDVVRRRMWKRSCFMED